MVSVGAELFTITIGLCLTRLWRGLDLTVPITQLSGFRKASRYLLRTRSSGTALLLELPNGLLHWGRGYGFLAKAACTGSALGGAVTMAVFGTATIPALGVLMITGQILTGSWRRHLGRASGTVVLVLGLSTLRPGIHAL